MDLLNFNYMIYHYCLLKTSLSRDGLCQSIIIITKYIFYDIYLIFLFKSFILLLELRLVNLI